MFFKRKYKKLPPTSYKPQSTSCPLQATPYKLKAASGFTLIELLVTLSLFVVLTTIVLFSNSKFSGSILLTNLAYDIAITIRQAQSFGVNVREDTTDTSSDINDAFRHSYGIHFDTSKNNKFLMFSDSVPGDEKYTGGWGCTGSGGDECIDTYSIKRGNKISAISAVYPSPNPNPNQVCTKLDIAFKRPDPDAKIKCGNSANNSEDADQATITIQSADGQSRNIVINKTGQISVEK